MRRWPPVGWPDAAGWGLYLAGLTVAEHTGWPGRWWLFTLAGVVAVGCWLRGELRRGWRRVRDRGLSRLDRLRGPLVNVAGCGHNRIERTDLPVR